MNERPRRGLSGFSLKLIALASMTVDHAGVVLFEQLEWMRMVGRLAFPIYAFLLVEGFVHTRHRGRYCLRLGMFALLSEWPFDLAVFGGADMRGQNVFFTLLLGVLMLWGCERFSGARGLRL
ncbi:MAG: TraX family protein, partial [Oscillospiraceae bacterium]